MILSRDPRSGCGVELAGWGESNDANHITGPSRDGAGLALAISRALHHADTQPSAIDYVHLHGTGTPYNDAMESKALARVFATAPDATARDGARALRLAQEMIAAIGDKDSNTLDTLAAAYAESGDFTQAREYARRAEELARNAGRIEEAADIAARVELYQASKAFHDG